ncbi:hypothetical protein DdX_09355 [Ditylenchus destructor]|uniref:Uncharacterized protein n=1 Tax=Ditylenchus destructor TaxID=166010 RepID=A0AAD4N5X7_9BILA|nr:hypothetical protein DdX_09355 [Ditylenchus destructor]
MFARLLCAGKVGAMQGRRVSTKNERVRQTSKRVFRGPTGVPGRLPACAGESCLIYVRSMGRLFAAAPGAAQPIFCLARRRSRLPSNSSACCAPFFTNTLSSTTQKTTRGSRRARTTTAKKTNSLRRSHKSRPNFDFISPLPSV